MMVALVCCGEMSATLGALLGRWWGHHWLRQHALEHHKLVLWQMMLVEMLLETLLEMLVLH